MTRVAVWGTGSVGSIAVRAIADTDDLELVAVWVHDPAKSGRDVGEFVGLGPIGLEATSDADAIVAARPDCVVYAATSPEQDAVNVPFYEKLLRAGINVVTSSSAGLVYPPAWQPDAVTRLTDAALSGAATLYSSGVEPGFIGDQLVAVLATASQTVTSVRTQEIFRYDTYPNEFAIFDVFGFGRPLESTPLMQLDGVQQLIWGPPVHYVAAALGVQLDSIRETFERRATPRELRVAAGILPAGTCGAIRMETIGVVDGRDAIIIEHVNRMAADLAPDWPDAERDGTYRIVIDGEPSMTCELTFGTRDGDDPAEHGLVATAMRLVNAIPFVAAAAPGLVTSLDLPLTTPKNAMRRRPLR